ncbi:hypothetical protein BS47DRAFT_1488618 [Hydnum rufescens UP504]|uniref:RlpA-like protein double-psi beta-barrel domain-containing protein n=1 Tax=Hydnum rufescens UP504 TaxID=1448309 RepID=A0A9P6AN67_9AGAM|nr:hypothetical protein BS47DRAFT_1488618 [Hydnum rufescens UP504]
MVAMITLTVFLAASLAAANPIRPFHSRRLVEALENRDYAQDADILEPYEKYHSRYLEWGCDSEHGKPFFDLCCHPKLKNDTTSFPSSCSAGCTEDPKDPVHKDPTPTHSTTSSKPLKIDPPSSTSSSTPYQPPKGVAGDPKPPSSTSSSSTKPPDPAPTKQTTSPFNLGGFATFFYQGGNAGACGTVHSDSDYIVAIDIDRYGDTGAVSPLCGKKVEITNADTGKSVVATIADVCPTCKNSNSIDLSVSTFLAIASLGEGMVSIKWQFV